MTAGSSNASCMLSSSAASYQLKQAEPRPCKLQGLVLWRANARLQYIEA